MRLSHQAVLQSHGDQAMGFPHDKTTHHFRMLSDGGVIEVTANDTNNTTNTAAIRSHLTHIAAMFSNGDLSTPMFIHDGVPPGVTTMKLMKSAIHYTYEEIPTGGKVRINSDDPIGVAATHDFLRFQIKSTRRAIAWQCRRIDCCKQRLSQSPYRYRAHSQIAIERLTIWSQYWSTLFVCKPDRSRAPPVPNRSHYLLRFPSRASHPCSW